MSIRKIGLIGYPLLHSFSKSYFSQKINEEGITDLIFDNIEMQDISGLPDFLLKNPKYVGLAVTIPHKTSILPFLDDIETTALEIGSVNCLKINPGNIKGFNTDMIGFEQSIKPLLKKHHTQALILGSGGSSKTVAHVLKKMGLQTTVVSRTPSAGMIGYEEVSDEIMSTNTVVVNCTPLGMFGTELSSPILPYEVLTNLHLFFDLIYNPEETTFLQKAKQRGATTCNGLDMLLIQAEENWKIWHQ